MPRKSTYTVNEEMLNSLREDYGTLSKKELENKYNIPYGSIKYICHKYNIKNKRLKKWTKELEETFSKDWSNRDLSMDMIKDKYNSTYSALNTKARELNIRRRSTPMLDKELEIINLYKNNCRVEDIQSKYHLQKSHLDKILEKHHIPKRKGGDLVRKYSIDDNVLDVIDTQEKAYFLGFFYADGHNNTIKGTFSISLQKRDSYILDEFQKLFKTKRLLYHKVIDGREYITLSITNRVISNKLLELGINSNKTYSSKFPRYLDDDLIRHFIRGYLDGDGYISLSQKRHCINLVGTYDMMDDMRRILQCELDHKSIHVVEEERSEKIYYLKIYGGVNVERFLSYIYEDSSIHLRRKYKRYIAIKERSKDGWKTRRERYGHNGISN
jgi:hypothetical protein